MNLINIQGVPELNVHILHVNSLRKPESKIIIPTIWQRHIYRVISHLSRPIRKFNLRGGKYMYHRRVCAWMQLYFLLSYDTQFLLFYLISISNFYSEDISQPIWNFFVFKLKLIKFRIHLSWQILKKVF